MVVVPDCRCLGWSLFGMVVVWDGRCLGWSSFQVVVVSGLLLFWMVVVLDNRYLGCLSFSDIAGKLQQLRSSPILYVRCCMTLVLLWLMVLLENSITVGKYL